MQTRAHFRAIFCSKPSVLNRNRNHSEWVRKLQPQRRRRVFFPALPEMRFPSLYVWQLSRCSVCFFFGALCVIFCGFNCVCCVFACCAFLCCIFVSCVVVGALCWFSFPSCIFYFWFLSLDLCFLSCIFRSCLRPAAAAALKSSHLVRSASDCRNSAAAVQLFCFFALSAHLSALRWADCVLARVWLA